MYKQGHTAMPITVLGLLGEAQPVFVVRASTAFAAVGQALGRCSVAVLGITSHPPRAVQCLQSPQKAGKHPAASQQLARSCPLL